MAIVEKTAGGVREPAPWLYDPARAVVRVLLRRFCGYRCTERDAIPETGPLFVVCAHEGMMDYLLSASAFPRRRLHYICTQHFFRKPGLSPLLRLLGVIPKIQFAPDARCMSAMLRTLRNGGAICISPAGQTSMCGVPGPIDPSIGRLAKKSGATVVAVRLNGSFFLRSRFCGTALNRGRIDAETEVLFHPEELKQHSEAAIAARIIAAIDYDVYAWQERTGASFRGKHRAKGYETIACICPKCGARYSYASKGDRLWCNACGNTGTVGADMHIHPEEGSVMPTTLRDWYRAQTEVMREAIAQPDFLLTAPSVVMLYDGRRYVPVGHGTLRMDREALSWEGEVNGERRMFSIRHVRLLSMACDPGERLDIYFEEVGTVRFEPDEGKIVTLWKIAQELLHQQALPAPKKEENA